jgi:glycosyltransferase involved in cell wall biosynthesis
MRIGVNLLYLRPSKVGGSEIYVRKLIHHLKTLDGVKIILFCSEEVAGTFSGNNYSIRIVSNKNFSQFNRVINENLTMSGYLGDLDLLFSPANFAIPFLLSNITQVVTVHDMQHLFLKEYFSLFKRAERSFLFKASFIKCKQIIAISEFTKLHIIKNFSITPERITTIHHGIEKKINVENLAVKRIHCDYSLTQDYFIFPATLFPHKNHFFLIDAFARFKKETKSEIQLILTGDHYNRNNLLLEYIKALGLDNSVRHLGFLEYDVVLALMTRAKALLFPSKFEGFGLPILEAMSCGIPVIASNAAAIPEVSGNAALLLEPDDLDGWSKAMAEILENENLRRTLVEKGYRNIERFSWERCVEQTIDVFVKALKI